jgi:lipoyl(octanoyl) transferase
MLSTPSAACLSIFDAPPRTACVRHRARNSQKGKGLVPESKLTPGEKTCWVVDLGLVPYGPACDLQRTLVAARKAGVIPDVLLLCEHPHVITLGRNGQRHNLRASKYLLAHMNVEFHITDRGGDITYHGPGQIVGYPILDLAAHRRDARWYVSQLEEVMMRATVDFGVATKRVEGQHGVWVDTPAGEEKLAALGVHLSRWVTSHGFAFNVSTDLRFFDLIVPCGIVDKHPASLERILGRAVQSSEVLKRLIARFGEVFGCTMILVTRGELEDAASSRETPASALLEAGIAKGSEA